MLRGAELSVIIPAYRSDATLARVLAALRPASAPYSHSGWESGARESPPPAWTESASLIERDSLTVPKAGRDLSARAGGVHRQRSVPRVSRGCGDYRRPRRGRHHD
jgi:hypothetical protein